MADEPEVGGTESLRDAYTAAFEQHRIDNPEPAPEVSRETTVESTAEPEADTRTAAERARDEGGRFVAKAGDKPAQSAKPEQGQQKVQAQAAATQQVPAKIQRPTSWKKDYWEHFDKLDPALQKYITQRESEYTSGVSAYKSESEKAKPFYEGVAPYVQEFEKAGVPIEQAAVTLVRGHMALVSAPMPQRVEMFRTLMRDYGIDPNSLLQAQGQQQATQQPYDPRFDVLSQRLQQQEARWESYTIAQKKAQQAVIDQEIEQFRADGTHPHFDVVNSTMAEILQLGQASTLQQAYDKAVRLHDDIFEQEQQKQLATLQEQSKQGKQQAAARARTNAVSPRSSPPTGEMKTNNSGGSIRDSYREAFREHGGGRI